MVAGDWYLLGTTVVAGGKKDPECYGFFSHFWFISCLIGLRVSEPITSLLPRHVLVGHIQSELILMRSSLYLTTICSSFVFKNVLIIGLYRVICLYKGTWSVEKNSVYLQERGLYRYCKRTWSFERYYFRVLGLFTVYLILYTTCVLTTNRTRKIVLGALSVAISQ